MDHFHLQKTEDLIARYSLIIFIFLKCGKVKQAKEIFLLMLKENMDSLNYIEKKICIKYLVVNKGINIYKDIPKITYQLAKIYSFIIKYSRLFNLTNYRNIFLDKYFQIQHLNYNFYMIKGSARGFSTETINQIKYWFSFCLHNSMYYTIYNYFPLRIPIILNYNILALYKNFDDNTLSDSEKSLLIKTSYNQGILYYLNGQNDAALINLNQAKEKIKTFSDDYYTVYNVNNKNNNQNIFRRPIKEIILEIKETPKMRKRSTTNPFKVKSAEKNNKNMKKFNKNKSNEAINFNMANNLDISNLSIISEKNKKLTGDISPKNKSEELKAEIYKGFKKDKVTLNDIELLLNFGKENGILNEEPTNDVKGIDFLFKYKESFSAIKKKITLPKGFRGSHINFHTSIKIKDFSIPELYKNPLLRKIELLMSLIELNKKNYLAAYEHVLKVLYIIFLLRIGNNNYYPSDVFNKLKTEINEYFKLIEDLYDIDFRNRQLVEKCSSKSILTINDRLSLNKSFLNTTNLNNSTNTLNNSFIIFENKALENNFYQKFISCDINANTDYNNTQNCVNEYNGNDSKIIKEFEKFFIFLNNLSIYQIKILNETQPDNEKRNDLPIMFTNQFKDCLSRIQRIELDNLQTMALSRFIVLKDPNKWIFPSNLNYSILKGNKKLLMSEKQSNYFDSDTYQYIGDTFIKTKDYNNYLNIINSEKSNREIKEYLKANKMYVFKIIKESSDEEIINMIAHPYLIIEPIKRHIKTMKKKNRNIKYEVSDKNKSNRPKTITHAFARHKIMKHGDSSKNNSANKNIKKYKKMNTSTEDSLKKNLQKNNGNVHERHCTVENVRYHKRKNNIEDSSESSKDFSLSPETSSRINDEKKE
jgi:hypothetical protein